MRAAAVRRRPVWPRHADMRQNWRPMETTENVTESPAAIAEEWAPELATVRPGSGELAGAAVAEHSGADTGGDYLGVGYEDPTSASHRFLAHLPGYQGWQWSVVVAAYPGCNTETSIRTG